MPDDKAHHPTTQVPTNLRLILLVEEIAHSGIPMSPARLSDALGLPRQTVHRLLNTAEEEGLVQRHIDGKSYGPGRRLRRIAVNTLSSGRMRTERLAILRALAEEIGETCNISVPLREGMTYLERVETKWPLRIQMPIGTKVPFHCTASGKMYLSSLRIERLDRLLDVLPLERRTKQTITDPARLKEELADTRARGYSTDNEEFLDGMAAVAVPICDDQGRLLSTLSVHAPEPRHGLDALTGYLDRLRDTAAELEALVLT